jgi:hypothetical protein
MVWQMLAHDGLQVGEVNGHALLSIDRIVVEVELRLDSERVSVEPTAWTVIVLETVRGREPRSDTQDVHLTSPPTSAG